MGLIFKECLLHHQLLFHTKLHPGGDLISLQRSYLQGSLPTLQRYYLRGSFPTLQRYYLQGSLPTLQRYHLQGSLPSVCVATLGADFHLSRPVLSHLVIYIHTCMHEYIYTPTLTHSYKSYIHAYIHTFMHMRAHIHAYTLSCTYIHTKIIYTPLHRPP